LRDVLTLYERKAERRDEAEGRAVHGEGEEEMSPEARAGSRQETREKNILCFAWSSKSKS
jgi:hypothetical protein